MLSTTFLPLMEARILEIILRTELMRLMALKSVKEIGELFLGIRMMLEQSIRSKFALPL